MLTFCHRISFLLLACFVFLSSGRTAAAEKTPPLSPVPLGERSFSISFNGERTGFLRIGISASSTGYEITSEGSVKMLVLGFSREASARESYRVGRNLALRSFSTSQVIDGSLMRLTGEVTAKGVKVTVETAGSRKEKLIKAREPVYPAAALNLLPLLQGTAPGKSIRVSLLDIEAVKVKQVEIKVIGREPLPGGGTTLHLRNDLYPFVDNDIWLDEAGKTIKESVRNDLIVTEVEDAASTTRFLTEAAVAKKDLILDFSLIRVASPIDRPADVRRLVVELTELPAGFPVPDGAGQAVARGADGRAVVTIERGSDGKGEGASPPDLSPYLQATDRILADNDEIKKLLPAIIGSEQSPRGRMNLLVQWVATNIAEAVTDSHSPLETLQSRKGNCQSHARLYASLARAAGIPTRFVSGVVYIGSKGFLYHSWAESFVGEWLAVDPTFGQVPADATHIKLVEGDSPAELAAIGGIVGKVGARVVEQRY
jgi:hypothetical protein